MQTSRNILILKSEPLEETQIAQLSDHGVIVQMFCTMFFEYLLHQPQLEEFIQQDFGQQIDYIIFNSVHSVRALTTAYPNNRQLPFNVLVVGEKTKKQVELSYDPPSIQTFANQKLLAQHITSQSKQVNLIYLLGNLSQIESELISSELVHIKSIVVYSTLNISETQFRTQMDLLDGDFSAIVYYSASNYEFFWTRVEATQALQKFKDVEHIYFGVKCKDASQKLQLATPNRDRWRVCENSKFEDIIQIIKG